MQISGLSENMLGKVMGGTTLFGVFGEGGTAESPLRTAPPTIQVKVVDACDKKVGVQAATFCAIVQH